MYFKRLEIFGFKSFADKTVLNFGPGITAVVGPNGCGKSNIFDAMRWVLGEQSVKELRGSSMDDVIFNGTDKKPSLGFAEVSLTFSNESHVLPIEYDEVTVTRRLFRSGESEYLLNKSTVRLKDILELFMGTGIGAEAYSLVQQGKVDLIVSARPEDRRIIIDEAAGITKYKSKKREALNKLKDSEDNLLRLNDIIVEVKRQIASLDRQANKARRYKEEFEKLKNFEIKFARHQIDQFVLQGNEINDLLRQFKGQESEFNQEFEKLSQLLSSQEELNSELERNINEVHTEDLKLGNQIEMNVKQISFNQERIESFVANEVRLNQQKEQLTNRCCIQQEKIASLKSALAALKETVEKNVVELQQKRDSLSAIAHAIKESKEAIKQAEDGILELTTKQVNLKNQLTEIMKEFQGALARKRRLELENAKVVSEKDEVDSKLSTILKDIEECSGKINDFKSQYEAKSQETTALKGNLSSLEETINNLEKKKLSLISQRQFIEEMQVQYRDIPDPIVEGTILTTMTPSTEIKGIIGKIKQASKIDPQKFEAFKNNFPQLADASMYEIICEMKFIELDPQHITAKIDELACAIEENLRQKETLISDIKACEEILSSLNLSIHDLEKVLSSFEAQKNNILQENDKLLGELDLVSQEIREVRGVLSNLKTKEDELSQNLESINQEIQMCQSNIREKQEGIALKSQEREETTVAVAQLETEIESANDKEESEQENLKIFEDALAGDLQEISRIDTDIKEKQEKGVELKAEIGTIEKANDELKVKRGSLIKVLDGYRERKEGVASQIAEIHGSLDAVQKNIENVRNCAHKEQLKVQQLSFDEKSIKDKLSQTYKINFDEIKAEEISAGDSQPEDVSGEAQEEISIESLAAEIERLKQKCESFGSVNLVAIEEFDELRQRFEFLTKQQSDLITARESLQDTISKINRTTRQLFLDTFTKVSEEFRIYFRMLFGGGEAQLMLVDPENVLESGIEIIARPPGKKLQNIMLMSGGEKTLAAIALIFGVFKVRPSPFCILDEIDAALDESNVGRFGYLLKDFSKISQFIVITHNKKTIVNADVMYGITMQETGVSNIVSVKFSDNNKKETPEEVPVAVS